MKFSWEDVLEAIIILVVSHFNKKKGASFMNKILEKLALIIFTIFQKKKR